MIILGFLGSPRLNGDCSKLLASALKGAESKGAEIKRFDLINCNIKDCRGCSFCFLNDLDLKIGKCTLDDEMASILKEYTAADGYLFTSPVYDGYVTALMKRFLERKIALTYRDLESGTIMPFPRNPVDFKKKASMIVTANCSDEFREAMGDPCFDAMEAHLMLEQVDTVDKLYVGSTESLTEETIKEKLDEAFRIGERLVEEIEKAK